MFNSQLDAIVPMLCVTLAALASMGAEAFRGRDERMPIGSLGLVGLAGAAVSAVLLWDRNAEGFGVIAADNFGLFITIVLAIVGVLTIMFSSQVIERDGIPAGEYYALMLFSIVGMIMMASCRGPRQPSSTSSWVRSRAPSFSTVLPSPTA
jgi:NADH-quinone oxidoreductase subunit N